MLSKIEILAVLAFIIPAILHAFGFFLLITTQFEDENLTQRLYFILLSFSELFVSGIAVVAGWSIKSQSYEYPVKMIRGFFGYTLMYEVMIALTVDRFLKIFLNIKYPLYWTYSRTVKLCIALLVLNGMMCLTFWLTKTSIDTLNTYYYLPFDIIFLIVAVVTYGYIFIKIVNNWKIRNSELSMNSQSEEIQPQEAIRIHQNKLLKQFMSNFLLVVTFLIFTVVPDLVYFCYGLNSYKDMKEWTKALMTIFYSISYICDFFIYTFSSITIRKKLLRWIRNIRRKTC